MKVAEFKVAVALGEDPVVQLSFFKFAKGIADTIKPIQKMMQRMYKCDMLLDDEIFAYYYSGVHHTFMWPGLSHNPFYPFCDCWKCNRYRRRNGIDPGDPI